jgi:hypothetical protein
VSLVSDETQNCGNPAHAPTCDCHMPCADCGAQLFELARYQALARNFTGQLKFVAPLCRECFEKRMRP